MTLTSDDVLADRARAVLRQLMKERGATQVQLAPVLGLTQVGVSDRVRGRTPLTLLDIERLADFFDVEPAVFVPAVRTRGQGLLPCTFGQHRWSGRINPRPGILFHLENLRFSRRAA